MPTAVTSTSNAPPSKRLELAGAPKQGRISFVRRPTASGARALARPGRVRPQLKRDPLGGEVCCGNGGTRPLLGALFSYLKAVPQHTKTSEGFMLTSIAGRSVIVTGASKGIGKGIAKVFCQNGGKVLVVSRNSDDAEACAEELRRTGGTARACAGDVNRIGDMQTAADTAAAVHGGIDILCANAGIFPQAKIEDLSSEDWDQVMATNLKGTFLAIKACLLHLKKSDQGRIVITSSITGPITGFPGWSHYGATKAGQLGFMRTACIELARYGITINAVLPGTILTAG